MKNEWRGLCLRIATFGTFAFVTSWPVFPQTPSAPTSHGTELNHEAGEVFDALKTVIIDLPPSERAAVMSMAKENVSKNVTATELLKSVTDNASQLLSFDASQLTYQQRSAADKAMIEALQQHTQQVVIANSGTLPSPATVQGLSSIAGILNQISTKPGTLTAASLAPLGSKYKSIGRLLWTKTSIARQRYSDVAISGHGFRHQSRCGDNGLSYSERPRGAVSRRHFGSVCDGAFRNRPAG